MKTNSIVARPFLATFTHSGADPFHLLVEAVTDYGIFLLDPAGYVASWNPGAAKSEGYTAKEIVGQHFSCFYTAEDVEAGKPQLGLQVALRDGRFEEEGLRRRKGGEPFWAIVTISSLRDAYGQHLGFVNVTRDISERKRAEEALRQSQRLDAIGELAAGVADDFNNLLGIISGYGELAKSRVTAEDPIRGDLEQILDASGRATTLARRLLALGRRQVLPSTVLAVETVVADLVQSLSGLIGREIELSTQVTPGGGQVRADRGQLEQVLLELALNARDAMPGGEPIVFEIRELELGEGSAADAPAAPGRYVLLTVRDTGKGMDAETQARIFEPFFTTKGNARGSGLGLSAVHGFAHQSGGFLRFESVLGVGTAFSLGLPLVEQETRVPAASAPVARSQRGHETVLLVEDEDALREMVQRVLEAEGYAVLAARDGDEALRIVENHGGPIEVVLTDLQMPGLAGLEVAERVVEARPGAKVLVMSGCGGEAVASHRLLEGGRRFLSKPFRLDALVHSVRDLLETN